MASQFQVKDSGTREQFSGGMVRDTTQGKSRPDLIRDGPMYQRWINHLTAGAVKYEARNWMKAAGQQEYERFLESADRHFHIWITWMLTGVNVEDPANPSDKPLVEDHAAACFFNINGSEFVKKQLSGGTKEDTDLPKLMAAAIAQSYQK